MSNMIENPFLNNKNPISYHDDNSDTIIELDQSNIGKYFDSVYILVKKNDKPIPVDFYDRQITQDVMANVSSNLLIHKTTIKLLKNVNHFNKIIILSDEQLKSYNIFNYTLGIKNIVIPILNIAYQNLLKYLDQYESLNTLEDIYKLKVLNQYFGIEDSNYRANEHLCMIMSNMEDSKYWSRYYNCSINFTTTFNARYFKFQSNRIENKTVSKIVKDLFEPKVLLSNTNEDYIKDMKQKDCYSDISSIVKKKGLKLYRISTKTEFTREDINRLFCTLNEKQKFILFSNLIVSKQHAHLVVNNFNILSEMAESLKTYARLFRYLFSYAWMKFYFEECIKKSFVNIKDDFIFDINTASKLPIFQFDHNNPKANPYMPILVSDSALKPNENVCGIQDYYTSDKTLNNKGICNLSEFLIRMNIFCTGNPNNNLFDGFDFEKHKVAITGSIITACIQQAHPLMSRFKSNTQTEQFNDYFNEYYAKSDIDVMLLAKDNFTFIDNAHEFHNTIILNVCKFNSPYAEPSHIKLKLLKLGYLFVSDDFINKNINFDENMQIVDKVKYVFDNINDENVRSKFKPYYEKLKIDYMNNLIKEYTPNELLNMTLRYPEIFDNNDVDFKIYVNNKKNAQDYQSSFNAPDNTSENNETFDIDTKIVKDIDLVYTFKFKIESPYINHNFELFPVRYDDFFSIVARFHLPCVRGLYNGKNVYLTPSCISAHMTYMNIDYKYICGTKDPIEIINKNRMRGFGTWLNACERKLFVKYSREIPFWNNLYTVDSNTTEIEANKQILGPLSLNHKMFRPRLYNIDEYLDNSMYVDTTNRYNDSVLPQTICDYNLYYNVSNNNKNAQNNKTTIQDKINSEENNKIDYDSLTAIDSNGYVIPLKNYIIQLTWKLSIKNNCKKTLYSEETLENQETSDNQVKDKSELLPKVLKKLIKKPINKN